MHFFFLPFFSFFIQDSKPAKRTCRSPAFTTVNYLTRRRRWVPPPPLPVRPRVRGGTPRNGGLRGGGRVSAYTLHRLD